MSSNVTYNVRIDPKIKKEADALYRQMGLSLSSAINLFLTQSVIQGKLPLTEVVSGSQYEDALLRDLAETKLAIATGEAKLYSTPEELFAEWDK